MTDIALVIFDCDGVLVDSEKLGIGLEVNLITETGWPITADEVVRRFLGKTDVAMRDEVAARVGRPLGAEWCAELHRRYDEVFAAKLTEVDGVSGVLDRLDAARMPYCVASSGKPEKIRHTLGLTGLLRRFDDGHLFSAVMVKRGKPAPDLFLHAAKAMGADPGRCAVVEDSPNGVRAALDAGMRPYAYAGGLVEPDRLALDDTVVFRRMSDLPDLLLG